VEKVSQAGTYPYVIGGNFRTTAFDNDHGTTYATTITRNIYSLMMVINVNAHEFTESPSPTKFPETSNKSRWVPRKTDYHPINVDQKGTRAVYFSPSSQSNIYQQLNKLYSPERGERLPSTPSMKARRMIGPSGTSVVICVISAKFLTNPQASPSGVSLGHNIPHWLGCKARGPLTFLVFSNCEVMRVIIPSAEMKLRRLRTWVTPARSILNRFKDQFPVDIARTKPDVIWSP
jgi:hypothetical protein